MDEYDNDEYYYSPEDENVPETTSTTENFSTTQTTTKKSEDLEMKLSSSSQGILMSDNFSDFLCLFEGTK